MKMRPYSLLSSLVALLCLLYAFAGCAATPEQNIALGFAAAGNTYATYELGKGGPATVTALTHLALIMPDIPLGKVSARELGQLNAELQVAKANLVKNEQADNQIGSLIALVSQNAGTMAGGNLTAHQAIIMAQFQNVANGISAAIAFYSGQQSVLHP